MSLRVDTSSLISGALVVGYRGLGVLGSEVPSTGENGPGYLYNDLSLPADANKEVCGRITTWPTNGDLFAYEDSSFTYDGTTDSFWYQLYVDGVATGSAVEVFLNVGETAFTFSATTGNATFSGSASSAASFSFSASTADATFSGSALVPSHFAFASMTAAARFSGSAAGDALPSLRAAVTANRVVSVTANRATGAITKELQ